jgi:hypothetical protein
MKTVMSSRSEASGRMRRIEGGNGESSKPEKKD